MNKIIYISLYLAIISYCSCIDLNPGERYTKEIIQYGTPNIEVTTSTKCNTLIVVTKNSISYKHSCVNQTFCEFSYDIIYDCSDYASLVYSIYCQDYAKVFIETTDDDCHSCALCVILYILVAGIVVTCCMAVWFFYSAYLQTTADSIEEEKKKIIYGVEEKEKIIYGIEASV